MDNFTSHFTGISLWVGIAMIGLGVLLRPIELESHFDLSHLMSVQMHYDIWVHSFQLEIFGLFITIMGLVGMGFLYVSTKVRAMMVAGIVVAIIALVMMLLNESYYMHMGAWGSWFLTQITDTEHAAFVRSLQPGHEWMVCINRMGNMFLSFAMVVNGVCVIYSNTILHRWLGCLQSVTGLSGMIILMIWDHWPDFFVIPAIVLGLSGLIAGGYTFARVPN